MSARLPVGLVVFSFMIVFSSCGSGNSSTSSHTGDPVTISPKAATLFVACPNKSCGVQQFEAVVQGASSSGVDWLVNGMVGGNTAVGTVSSSGLYTAPNAVGSGNVVVTARSQADATQSDSAAVSLQNPPANVSQVTPNVLEAGATATSITISGDGFSPSATAYLGGNPLPTTFLSNQQIRTSVPSSSLGVQNTLWIGAENPPPHGGGPNGSPNNGAALYVVSGTFEQVGDLNIAREGHTATLLPNGKVLVAGGVDSSGNVLASAELFDAQTNTFQLTGSMTSPRLGHSATGLANGKVLIAGGMDSSGVPILQTAELYDPSSATFTPVSSQMTYPHSNNSVLLNNGQVLLLDLFPGPSLLLDANGDVYDPSTNAFAPVPTNNSPTGDPFNVPCLGGMSLSSGKNLVAVGMPYYFDTTNLSYSAADPTFATNFGLQGCSLTLQTDGTIFAAGGWTTTFNLAEGSRAQVWDPVSFKDKLDFQMSCPLADQAAALLQSGEILLVGGGCCPTCDEIFDPVRGQAFIGPSTIIFRSASRDSVRKTTVTRLLDGRVLVVGGTNPPGTSPVAEVYVPPGP